jgi:hypothetical protein
MINYMLKPQMKISRFFVAFRSLPDAYSFKVSCGAAADFLRFEVESALTA